MSNDPTALSRYQRFISRLEEASQTYPARVSPKSPEMEYPIVLLDSDMDQESTFTLLTHWLGLQLAAREPVPVRGFQSPRTREDRERWFNKWYQEAAAHYGWEKTSDRRAEWTHGPHRLSLELDDEGFMLTLNGQTHVLNVHDIDSYSRRVGNEEEPIGGWSLPGSRNMK